MSTVIAICALVFTVTSFWWLNARRGRLTSYAPHSFGAYFPGNDVLIRLPVVIFNTGAVPIVVQDLRLVFPQEPGSAPMPWRSTRKTIRVTEHDYEDLPAVFAVPGRDTRQLFADFGPPFPGRVPSARDYAVCVEAKMGHLEEWSKLVTFTLRAWHITSPGGPGTYSNSKQETRPNELAQAREALDSLAARVAGAESAG